jgi:predicted RNase H-like HicB family nuclease
MIRYEMIIYWSEDDQAFIVEVPELPGCMADGPTDQAALTNAEQVVQD